MSKYKEITYLVLDELKLQSDDAEFNEEHIIFLANKYRAYLLEKKYSNKKDEIPDSNYLTLCLSLTLVPAISGEPCEGGTYLRSTEKIPEHLSVGIPRVTPVDYYQGMITLIDRERMKYVGYNKYLKNIIYCSEGPDGYLYFKSSNPLYLYLENVKYTGIFEDAEEAANLSCSEDSGTSCDILDLDFPLEDALIPLMIDLIVKELTPAEYHPTDDSNDSADSLTGLSIKK